MDDTVSDAGKHRNTRVKPTILKAIKEWLSQQDPVIQIASRLRFDSVA
jgi:hypothetical protein